MKTIEIVGNKRTDLGKQEARSLRREGHVPCVLYGLGEQVHFAAPMIFFRDLVYTNEARFVQLNIAGNVQRAILQDIQFHPVSEMILHADFLRIDDDRKVKMSIPVRLTGQSVGVRKGGTLVHKKKYLRVYGYPKDMPDHIDVDISDLDFHNAIKVADIPKGKLAYLDVERSSIAVVEVPRAAKMAAEEEAPAAEEEAPAAEEPEGDKKE